MLWKIARCDKVTNGFLSGFTRLMPGQQQHFSVLFAAMLPAGSSVISSNVALNCDALRVLENAAKKDVELRNVLGDTIGNPDQMRLKSFSPVGSNICFKLYKPPSDGDVDLIGYSVMFIILSVLPSNIYSIVIGYSVMLANISMEYNPLYDADKGFNIIP
nr:hypothetical protein [Tanacetum cinerariifolium]